jgi:hypothetical protein
MTNDPDYILMARFDNSLAKALARYPDGAPPHVVARALGISEAQVEAHYQAIVVKLRKDLAVEE